MRVLAKQNHSAIFINIFPSLIVRKNVKIMKVLVQKGASENVQGAPLGSTVMMQLNHVVDVQKECIRTKMTLIMLIVNFV